ncbi:5'-nucleotidase [Bradyrhizobium sp. BEA-2-5]|nr:5'-nucleotidase [Bradyrhizobium sp. BEA-2-5]WOH80596.1 5'-nucleotidase [Bradyrhizobium sp. BEA-2-5]
MVIYVARQFDREDAELARLNEPDQKPYVEVHLLSRNSTDLSLQAFHSIDKYGLGIKADTDTE